MTKFFKGLAKKLVISILTTALSIFILLERHEYNNSIPNTKR